MIVDLLLPTDKNGSKSIEPTVRSLNHPACWRYAWFSIVISLFLTARSNVCGVLEDDFDQIIAAISLDNLGKWFYDGLEMSPTC